MDLGDALAWLDRHQNLERILADGRTGPPDPERMRRLADVLGNPQTSAPVIHITGTNGKTSTSRAVTALLMAKGLTVGTFTSPHLQSINERIGVDGQPITDEDLAAVLSDLAALETLLGDDRPTWFELMTAAALRFFADRPVDVMVLEVGLGGRFDATNVADATVAVVTNIGLDHVELLGPTRRHVAAEKAGIVKPGSTLVLGEPDPDLLDIFALEGPDELWWVGRDFAVTRNELAVGGRLLDIRTPGRDYTDIWLDLHGSHQADNFAAALVAVETFFASPIEERLVRQAAGGLRSPGRLEIVRRSPLVILDGAKNVEGAAAAAAAVRSDFGAAPPEADHVAPGGAGSAPGFAGGAEAPGGPVGSGGADSGPVGQRSVILVVGMLAGKDPDEMLTALDAGAARLVIACPPPSPRAVPAAEVAAAARRLGAPTAEAETVADALAVALEAAGPDDVVLVTGSLYVVGAARASLAGLPAV
jgi:dihydrofolate synthase/folylpolyglutamate synthase